MSAITPPPDIADQAARHGLKLERIGDLLDQLVTEIGLGGGAVDRITDNLPLPGLKRHTVSGHRATGNDALAIPIGNANAVLISDSSPGRLAGNIVNLGANPVILYLSSPARVGTGSVAAIWIGAGGAWDFMLSRRLWCGAVSAVAQTGATTLTVAIV